MSEDATPYDAGKRRMPDNLRKFLIRLQGGKSYLPAAYRLVWFRDECPDCGIITELIEGGQEAQFSTVRASILTPDGRILATGTKTETAKDFPAGWVEKSETGAIARALAVAGFGTQFLPELDDVEGEPTAAAPGPNPEPRTPNPGVWPGPGQCPKCHAPEGKRHAKTCGA